MPSRVVPSPERATLGDPVGELLEPLYNTLETRGSKKAVGAQERDPKRRGYIADQSEKGRRNSSQIGTRGKKPW